MRNDKEPFTDVRVRQALQMAIDLPTIDSYLLPKYFSTVPYHFNHTVYDRMGFPV